MKHINNSVTESSKIHCLDNDGAETQLTGNFSLEILYLVILFKLVFFFVAAVMFNW